MKFTCIKSEGGLLPLDILEQVVSDEYIGQRPSDFGIDSKRKIVDEISAAFNEARDHWKSYQHSLNRLRDDEPKTSVTREKWMIPLLRSLDYDPITYMAKAAEIEGRTYAISHRAGKDESAPPVHIEGSNVDIDKRKSTGRPRLSPHSLVQEYLNRTEHLWGIVTNGHVLRILRNSTLISRPAYIEFDLEQMMKEEKLAEFNIFYRLVHRSRFPRTYEDAPECILEKYYQQAVQSGGRVREKLRDGVEEALRVFGNGFLSHPANDELRRSISSGELSALDYYRQLLRLVYRFLFLMVAEERNLVGPSDPQKQSVYYNFYSITRLRALTESRPIGSSTVRHQDLWQSVLVTFRLYDDERLGEKLTIAPLNGDLFGQNAIPALQTSRIYNTGLLTAIRNISLYRENNVNRRVNYAALDVEELGSVYESLLDFQPSILKEDGKLTFDLITGTERKSTGSYYTRPELVNELIKSALMPVVQDKVKTGNTPEEKIESLLGLKICDSASGSGHFLLAAARKVGNEVAKLRSGEEHPTPSEYREAVRDVIQRCIYGVDLNPLAVDLCKLALWIEGHTKGKPLSFLDHRIRCGNSLIGVLDGKVIREGIPDGAFKPVTGDDKKVASWFKRRNKSEREERQISLQFRDETEEEQREYINEYKKLNDVHIDTPEDYHNAEAILERIRNDRNWVEEWNSANLWTYAFFAPLRDVDNRNVPTTDSLIEYIDNPRAGNKQMIGVANAAAVKNNFFHWYLEFPEVFENDGFDVVLGNPPWERIKLQEKEFFATRDPEIAKAPNAAERKRLIGRIQSNNPDLYEEFINEKRRSECESIFLRESGRYPLTAKGDINTYAVFSEHSRKILNGYGRVGIIVPSGIATDDTTKEFFADLIESESLVSLYDFENKGGVFADVHRSYKFCLLTICGNEVGWDKSDFTFFLKNVDQLKDEDRHFTLTKEELALLNPNTKTCPIFRSKRDAEITKKIYSKHPVLVNENDPENGNPWGIAFMRMFDMSNDSHLFRTKTQLENEGFVLEGNKYVRGEEVYLPLYEAKMIWQFDHRFGTYEGREILDTSTSLVQPTLEQKMGPNFCIIPRYWVREIEVLKRLAPKYKDINDFDDLDENDQMHLLRSLAPKWLIGFRSITNSTNERTTIITVIPRAAVSGKLPILLSQSTDSQEWIVSILGRNSFVFDFISRQKVGGTDMSYFIFKQLPTLCDINDTIKSYIEERVLKLIFTAYDLADFALENYGMETPVIWDEEKRFLLKSELDAVYAHLYNISRGDLDYILETFPIVKRKDLDKYGEYRTKRMILEEYDRLTPIFEEKEIDEKLLREYVMLYIGNYFEREKRTKTVKLLYILQVIKNLALRYNWKIEKFGPYDEEFIRTLKRLESDGLIEPEDEHRQTLENPIRPTADGLEKFENLKNNQILNRYDESIEEVLSHFRYYGSKEMELRATLIYLHVNNRDWGYSALIAGLKKEKDRKFSDREIEDALDELVRLGYVGEVG